MTIFDPPLPPYQRLIKWGGVRAKDKYLVAPLRRPPPHPPPGGGGGGGVPAGGATIRGILGRGGGFKNGHYFKKTDLLPTYYGLIR